MQCPNLLPRSLAAMSLLPMRLAAFYSSAAATTTFGRCPVAAKTSASRVLAGSAARRLDSPCAWCAYSGSLAHGATSVSTTRGRKTSSVTASSRRWSSRAAQAPRAKPARSFIFPRATCRLSPTGTRNAWRLASARYETLFYRRSSSNLTSNQAMERTAGDFGFSPSMKFHLRPAVTRSPQSRRSSCSR